MPILDWLWLVPVLIVAGFIGFGLSMAFEPGVIEARLLIPLTPFTRAKLQRRLEALRDGSAGE